MNLSTGGVENNTAVLMQVDSGLTTKWRDRQCANTDGLSPAISISPRKQGF